MVKIRSDPKRILATTDRANECIKKAHRLRLVTTTLLANND